MLIATYKYDYDFLIYKKWSKLKFNYIYSKKISIT